MALFGGKKKRQGLSEVIHESVPETALDVFIKNANFRVMKGGRPAYTGLLFKAENIGGLSKKDARDEAKGSIVEIMNSGRISVYAKEDMLQDNRLVIIPTALTLDAMSEFGILVKCPYEWVLVEENGGVFLTGLPATFEDALSVAEGRKSIQTFIDENAMGEEVALVNEVADDSDDAVYQRPEDEDIPYLKDDEDDEDFEDIPEIDEDDEPEVEYLDDDDDEEFDESEVYQDDFDDDEGVVLTDEDHAYLEGEDEDEEPFEEEVIISDEDVEATLVRRFYSEELGLEVDPSPFDMMFIKDNPFIPFNTERSPGWLNDYLNEMSVAANVEMERVRKENLYLLRERYLTLMNLHCERIENDLSLSDDSNHYGQMQDRLRQVKVESLADVPRQVSLKKQELEKDWNERLAQIGEDAARAARRTHEERYGRSHQETLYRIEPELRDNIEQRANSAKREVLQARKDEAAKMLDLGINETLKELSVMYGEMIEAERVRYGELQAQMNHFIDENRKDDVARIQALQEELDQKAKADKVSEELTAKIHRMTAEFEAKILEGKQELSLVHQANERVLSEQKAESESRVKRLNDELNRMTEERNSLMDKYLKLDEVNKGEYESRINTLKQDKMSADERLEHVVKSYKTGNRIAVIGLVVALVAAIAIGLIGGYYLGQRGTMEMNRAVYEQYQEAIEKQTLPNVETPGN